MAGDLAAVSEDSAYRVTRCGCGSDGFVHCINRSLLVVELCVGKQ